MSNGPLFSHVVAVSYGQFSCKIRSEWVAKSEIASTLTPRFISVAIRCVLYSSDRLSLLAWKKSVAIWLISCSGRRPTKLKASYVISPQPTFYYFKDCISVGSFNFYYALWFSSVVFVLALLIMFLCDYESADGEFVKSALVSFISANKLYLVSVFTRIFESAIKKHVRQIL